MIKAVIFDFVQTLGTAADGYKKAEKNSQTGLFDKISSDSICQWEEYIDLYRKERKDHFLRNDFSRKNVWIKLCGHYNIPADNEFLDSLEEEYWEIVKKSMKLFPEALSVLAELKKNYKLGLVSNSQKDGSTKALDNDEYRKLESMFDVIIIAGEAEIPAKPDPAPFVMALEKLRIRPEEAVFVGDDFRIDIEGSRNAGITPVWLKHYSVERSWPEASFSVPEIIKLEQLLEIDKLLKKT